jgi:hypothetical protein
MTSSAAKRRRSAYAAAAAAKERRRKILAIGGSVVFVALLAYEIPHTLQLLNHSTPAAAVTTTTTAAPTQNVIPKSLQTAKVGDPFAARALVSVDPGVKPSPGGRDPFASTVTQAAAVTQAPAAAQPLPQTIVIGTPTAHGAVDRGWIVILASIPTREGRSSALTFARAVRRSGISSVAVLNSSNRRPLRGGYWVVYTGPVATLGAVQRLASSVHASGYGTAYIRELIVYR